jgi:threonylcarbamoyladenosine tRNA methylthiotransferase MtaB
MKKVAFYTLGCKLNFAESSSIARSLEPIGFTRVDFQDSPNLFVINTCSVTEQADKKCKKVVREAKKINPASTVVIMGCYAQLKPEEISNIPGVDLVLGANEKFQLPDLILPYLNKKNTNLPKLLASKIRYDLDYHASYSVNDRTRTFLKVQDGCDYPCSYCTIPLARGQSRSDTVESVLALIEEIAEKGVKEIVLTGVNIGDFGIQQGKREETFFNLIKAIEFKSSIYRFRISSIEPNLITPEIITFLSSSNSFVPHFHIPLQSGSNAVLRLMRQEEFIGPVNIGSEEMVTINTLAELAIAASGKNITIKNVPGPTGVRGRNSDNKLIEEKLDWVPNYPLYEGLIHTFEWINKQVNK